MKLINSSFEIILQENGLEGILKQIEKAARVCYKSENNICDGSAERMVESLIKRGHLSPLEHGTIYLDIPHYSPLADPNYLSEMDSINFYYKNPYSKVVKHTEDHYHFNHYITTNYRVIIENNRLDDLQYLCEPNEHHKRRVSVKVNCSIGISREWNRHRIFSICEQSTRYCNYSKDKFNNEITFIKPYWYDKFNESLDSEGHRNDGTSDMFTTIDFLDFLSNCEAHYLSAIIAGAKPQEAREMLPLCTATEVMYTGFTDDWNHFFDLRCSKAAHPDIQALAIPLKEEFAKLGYVNNNISKD